MDSHLHRFAIGGDPFDRTSELFLCPYDAEEGEDDGTPASEVTLDETLAGPGDVLFYVYDYGDSWDLRIVLEEISPLTEDSPSAVCIDGRRAAPPEDCGGMRDAEDLTDVIDDPAHFDLAGINQALQNPFLGLQEFGIDPRLVDLPNRLRHTEVGDDLVVRAMSPRSDVTPDEQAVALGPFLWFLDHLGDHGLPLTSAGYLKPDDVLAVSAVLPTMTDWIGTNNREHHTFLTLVALRSLGAPPGISSASSRCSRFTVCTRSWDSSSRRSTSSRSATGSSLKVRTFNVGVRSAAIATACASVASVLRALPVSNTRTRAASFAGTSTTVSSSASSRCASGRPTTLGHSRWPPVMRPLLAHIRSLVW
jgi:hypothetical protein